MITVIFQAIPASLISLGKNTSGRSAPATVSASARLLPAEARGPIPGCNTGKAYYDYGTQTWKALPGEAKKGGYGCD